MELILSEENNTKSYVVEINKVGVKVKPSHWLPGYTAAHKATEKEAILYAIASLEQNIEYNQQNIEDLVVLGSELE